MHLTGRAPMNGVMATFLRDPLVLRVSVIATQEPWRNEYDDTTHQPARLTHQLLYPKASNYDGVPARVALYVSKQIDPASWTHIVVSPNYQILHISYVRGEESRDLYIHNVYNDTKLDTIALLDQRITQLDTTSTQEHLPHRRRHQFTSPGMGVEQARRLIIKLRSFSNPWIAMKSSSQRRKD
ncbi:Endonuclease/exonuclease/phosphatase [Penicillium occitanis (nom. inval.)]|nr:Endonuclease/exonuclease/phosphatase [Penicillium occitanis (nom. inval.)]PCG89056.1 hypothetical protein PENOC_108270 [Penicillium occitanis (nom. inval.)]